MNFRLLSKILADAFLYLTCKSLCYETLWISWAAFFTNFSALTESSAENQLSAIVNKISTF